MLYAFVRIMLTPFFLLYFRFSLIGRENIPKTGPAVLASNHRSNLDPFMLCLMTKRPLHFVAKAELFESRLGRWFFSSMGAFPVRRGRGDMEMVRTAQAILRNGGVVAIFPEGTRVRRGAPGEPHRGLGRLALDSRAPIVPVAIAGTERVRYKWVLLPRKVRASAAKPLGFPQPDGATPRIARTLMDRVWPQVEMQWHVLNGSCEGTRQLAAAAVDAEVTNLKRDPKTKPTPTVETGAAEITAEVTEARAEAVEIKVEVTETQVEGAEVQAEAAAPEVAAELQSITVSEPPRRLTPLERLTELADPGTLELTRTAVRSPRMGAKAADGDGLVAGHASVDGRRVYCFAQDSTYLGGSLGTVHAEGVVRTVRAAGRARVPVIGFVESGGARLQEGIAALEGYGRIFHEQVRNSGVVPQISVVCGAAAGGGAYGPALGDFVVMTDAAAAFLTGPGVVADVTSEVVDAASLGGPQVHERNGVCHLRAPDDAAAAAQVRELLSYLPDHRDAAPPRREAVAPPPADIGSLVPANPRKVYDVKSVIHAIADEGQVLEIAGRWAPNVVCAFARLDGRSVGVIASQPSHLAGVLDTESSQKAARFVHTCDSFRLPLLVLVDTPGFLPGVSQERDGVIRHGATLVRAFSQATVPSVTVVLRKAFGGAYIAMNSRALGADYCFAWPQAQLGVMGAEQAVGILHRRPLEKSDDPQDAKNLLAAAYAEEHLGAGVAAAGGFVDAVIDPAATRERAINAFTQLDSAGRAEAPAPVAPAN